jgi:hypothetical protein
MSNPTSNFNWQMPTATDLVTDLPADFEVFGQAVDSTLADLKGGTTGQVLKKNTNADMDFVWGTDTAGMTNPMTTTGDTIYSSSGSTPARLGIGTAGQFLKVNSGATAPEWATIVTGPTFTGVGVYKGANQSIANATSTAVSFNSEYFDTDAYHDNATNNSRLTIPAGKGGKYQINYNVNWDANATGSRQAIVYLNNTTVISLVETDNAGAGRGVGLSGSLIYSLAAADYIQVLVFQNSGGALDCLSGGNPTTFSISYLGA